MDKLDPAANAIQQIASTSLTATLIIVGLFGIIAILAWVLIRNSTTQNALSKAQTDLMGKQLEAFNSVANQVSNLERTMSLQNIKQSEYTDNNQKYLTSITKALDSTLQKSIESAAVLARVEENGKKMTEKLDAANKSVGDVATDASAAKSGIHDLTLMVSAALRDISDKLETVAKSIEDLPQIRAQLGGLPVIREQLENAINGIEQLKHDVQRMDVPRTETKPPDAPPVSAEGD